jgi:cytochrome P450
MFISKGSMCLVNVGLCNRDPDIYGEDATLFDPSRHLTPDGAALAPGPQDTQDEEPWSNAGSATLLYD